MGRIKSDISGKKCCPNLPSQSNLQHSQQLNHGCGCFNPSGARLCAAASHSPALQEGLEHSTHHTQSQTGHTVRDPSSGQPRMLQGWIFQTPSPASPISTQVPQAPTEHCCEMGVQPHIPSDRVCHRLRKINNLNMPRSGSLLPVHMKGKH